MINGIIKTNDGFAVKDFSANAVMFRLGKLHFSSYEEAVEKCRAKYYPISYYQYLKKVGELKESGELVKEPDADIWENLIYALDYRGVWDGTKEKYKPVTSVDKGAATDDEIDYVDALAATYESLVAMVKK